MKEENKIDKVVDYALNVQRILKEDLDWSEGERNRVDYRINEISATLQRLNYVLSLKMNKNATIYG